MTGEYRPRPHDHEIEPMFGALGSSSESGSERSAEETEPAQPRKPGGCLVLFLCALAATIFR